MHTRCKNHPKYAVPCAICVEEEDRPKRQAAGVAALKADAERRAREAAANTKEEK